MRNSAQLSIAQMVKAATSLVFRRTEITCKRFIISESSEKVFIIRVFIIHIMFELNIRGKTRVNTLNYSGAHIFIHAI